MGNFLNHRGLVGAGAEIGVYEGQFSETILKVWRGLRLYLIDPWTHMPDYLDSWRASDEEMLEKIEIVKRRLQRYAERVEIIRATSAAACASFADQSLDFVYIDANHAYQHVCQDLELWTPKVRVGGIVAGHDYFDALPDADLEPILTTDTAPESLTSYGVKSAVDDFVGRRGFDLGTTEEQWPTWYFFKTHD